MCMVRCHTSKKDIGDKRFFEEYLLTVDDARYSVLSDKRLNFFFTEKFRSFFHSAIGHSQSKPSRFFAISYRYIRRGHPITVSFGGDTGGKSSVRRIFPASSGVGISQCVHIGYSY